HGRRYVLSATLGSALSSPWAVLWAADGAMCCLQPWVRHAHATPTTSPLQLERLEPPIPAPHRCHHVELPHHEPRPPAVGARQSGHILRRPYPGDSEMGSERTLLPPQP